MPRARSAGPRRVVVVALSGTAVLLLALSTVVELTDADPHTELWMSIAAGIVFLAATGFSRGADVQVLAVRARLLVGAGLSALLAVTALWQATERAAPRVLLLLLPVTLLFTTAGLALREADHQRRQARLRELRAHYDGQERERRRWVRELHDETLQEMGAAHVLLGVAAASPDPAEQAQRIADARDVLGRQIHTLRRLIARMRPLTLDTLGLGAALEDLARHAVDATGLDVQVYVEDLPRLPADTETQIYRIAQEALTNAMRHAAAHRITVEAHGDERGVEVAVRDNGTGRPAMQFRPGYGLTGMRERAETLGARLTITNPEPTGTLVHLQVPLPAVR